MQELARHCTMRHRVRSRCGDISLLNRVYFVFECSCLESSSSVCIVSPTHSRLCRHGSNAAAHRMKTRRAQLFFPSRKLYLLGLLECSPSGCIVRILVVRVGDALILTLTRRLFVWNAAVAACIIRAKALSAVILASPDRSSFRLCSSKTAAWPARHVRLRCSDFSAHSGLEQPFSLHRASVPLESPLFSWLGCDNSACIICSPYSSLFSVRGSNAAAQPATYKRRHARLRCANLTALP